MAGSTWVLRQKILPLRWVSPGKSRIVFALASQEKARAAIAAGRFKDEIVPLTVPQGRKKPDKIFDTDESFPRRPL